MCQASLYLMVVIAWMSFRLIDMATINGNPSTYVLNENDDNEMTLWEVSATCNPSNGNTTYSIDCNTCVMSNPNTGPFFWSDNSVKKKKCADTNCGTCPSPTCSSCSTSDGCLTGPAIYTISVECSTTGYETNDSGTETLTVSVTEETPTLSISVSTPVPADNTMSVNDVLTRVTKSSGPAILAYSKSSAVANTYQLNTANMFELNTANGDIYVATDPSLEYDSNYSMRVCIHSRRQESCETIEINFDGCFETPNCKDQTITTFSDQHAIGATLFEMTYDDPSPHFDTINSTWQNLHFEKVSSTLSEASIHQTTGVITTTGNVTVWPDHPHSSHNFVVNVSNPGYSCSYTSTCTMTMQFSFTNWPIRFVNLPNSSAIHEDTDARTLVHSIVVYDDNNPDHDNVTCSVTANDDSNLLELWHDGNYTYNAWFIYKKKCGEPNCGYVDNNFECDLNIGCMNYDLTDQYTITIKCKDAYDSEVEEVFTLNLLENQPPEFTNTPTTITLNTDRLAFGDKVFSIYYSDDEKETLDYNFTITPTSPSLFAFDSRGNYYDDPANVTSTIFQWDLQNSSFAVSFCGRERRNIVCSSFTIDIREYCGPTPSCTDTAVTKTDQFPVSDELFKIPVTGSGYTSLSYVIVTQYSSLFDVDSGTGSVTTLAALPVQSPPDPTTYSIIGNVYDTAACDYAACSLTVTVTFTNFDISITNMAGLIEDIHEDTTVAVTLLTIATSDNNTNDGVTCEVDDAASTPANNGLFSAVETDTGSNVFELISQAGPVFDYSATSTYTIVVTCEDNYGSSDTASMTVNILENQIPTMDNLNAGDIINVDPMAVSAGYTIFTLQTSDDENDELDYSCSVINSIVPLECLSDGVVSLRRNIRIPEEDGEVYNITMCIVEATHNHDVCETLSVNFTSSKTSPVLDNLPASVSFDEDSSIGRTLYTVTVEDPDISDVHTLSMTVYPKTSSSTFFLDSNSGEITLAASLDYETLNSYVFLISVRDQYLDGLEDKYLNLYVLDVNEAPTLSLNQTTFSTIEEAAGYVVATLAYTCTDVDTGQTMNLSITSGIYMSYFSLDSASGIITYAQDWDFENAAVPPHTTTLQITCDDGNGSSDSTNIIVNISPKNEFAPVLSLTKANVTIYNNQTLLDPLFVVTATDADYDDDGVFGYSIVGTGKGYRYFRMSDAGQLLLQNYIDWKYDYTWEFTVKVTDGESEPLDSFINVIVTYVAPDPVIPTKEKARCILCTELGKGVVVSLCIEAFIILVLLIHCCCRMKCSKVFQLKPKPRVQTIADLKKMMDLKEMAEDPYLHDPDMLSGALPSNKPPSKFRYDKPVKMALEPPGAAEYLPPGAVINLAHIAEPVAHARTNKEVKVTAEVYSNDIKTRSGFGNKVYYYTKQDQSSADSESREQLRIRRLFKTPDKTEIYGGNATHSTVYDEDGLDF